MDWDFDLRIVAVIFVILGIAGGMYLEGTLLLIISLVLVVGGFVTMYGIRRKPSPAGTSGDLGVLILVVCTCVLLIIPAWIAYTIKLYLT
jgi:hypothetical protein